MATENSTTLENNRIAGGKACMDALRKFEVVIPGNKSKTAEGYYRNRNGFISDFVAQAGELSPRAAGFVEAVAEFIHLSMETGGDPNLEVWKAESSMSPEELAAEHQEFTKFWNS